METTELTEEMVVDFLKQNNSFFLKHDELLLDLKLPHQSGQAVSLMERQVSVLRERNIDMRHRLGELMDAGKANDALFSLTKDLVLSLIDAESLDKATGTAVDTLTREFALEAASLIILSDSSAGPNIKTLAEAEARQALGGLLDSDLTVCGVFRDNSLEFLFGEDGKEIGSAAMTVLRAPDDKPLAVLAVGSADPHHFKSGMGTIFLDFIAAVLTRRIPQLLEVE